MGGRGSDKLFGVGGLDELKGGGGDDTINGGDGSDTITGGAGNDVMNGGRGPDTFVYTAVDQLGLTLTTADFFKGFTPGSDTVDLSAIDAIAGGADDEFTLEMELSPDAERFASRQTRLTLSCSSTRRATGPWISRSFSKGEWR